MHAVRLSKSCKKFYCSQEVTLNNNSGQKIDSWNKTGHNHSLRRRWVEGPGSLFSSSSSSASRGRFWAARGETMQFSSSLGSPSPSPQLAPMLVLDNVLLVLAWDGEDSASLSQRADGAIITKHSWHSSDHLPSSQRIAACALALATKPPAAHLVGRETEDLRPFSSPKSSLMIMNEVSRSTGDKILLIPPTNGGPHPVFICLEDLSYVGSKFFIAELTVLATPRLLWAQSKPCLSRCYYW